MQKCDFCSKQIPKERIHSVKTTGGRVKYCSNRCNKLSWAKKHNQIKNSFENGNRSEWLISETGKGYYWEHWVARKLDGQWQGFNKPFDISCSLGKIDVKVCELYKRPNKRGKVVKNRSGQRGWWVFNKNTGNIADSMYCIGLVNGVPFREWLIPKSIFSNSVTISPNSKRLDKYLVK